MKVISRVANNLDKRNDMQEYDSPDLDVKGFNSGESFRSVNPKNRKRFIENRRRFYEMRNFLSGKGE